jgi:small subunit ribosomal protein S11
MGKKRIIKKKGATLDKGLKARALSRIPKRKLQKGIINILSTYNNTLISLADEKGGTVIWSSSGSLGFKGAKKGTPYAASKIAELVADKAKMIGLKEADVVVKGVGAGRESAIRTFASKGITINLIRDVTPVPHNGPRPKKPRRV